MPKGGPLQTIEEILQFVRRFLAEPGPSRFSDATLYAFIDLAAQEVAEDTGCNQTRLEVNWAANISAVDLESDIFDIICFVQVLWLPADPNVDMPRYELQFIPVEQMTAYSPDITGIPSKYSLHEWTTYGGTPPSVQLQKIIRLYPTPSDNGRLRIHYVSLAPNPAAADRPTQPIGVRRAWRDLVIHKALQYAYENLGRPDMAREQQVYYEQMLSGVRLRLLDNTTTSYVDYFDGHRFDYV